MLIFNLAGSNNNQNNDGEGTPRKKETLNKSGDVLRMCMLITLN